MNDVTRYPAGPRTTPTRKPDRAVYDVDAVHAVLDEALICHVGTVVDGEPVVLPTIHARLGGALYLHSSTGSRLARAAAADDGVAVCLTATLVDGITVARSQMHHGMNYRSVVVRGRAVVVTDPGERGAALTAIVDHVVPGRSAQSRPPNARELAATAVLRIELVEATLKQRSGPPSDDDADLALPYWAGVIPVMTVFGSPEPVPELRAGLTVTAPWTGRGTTAAPAAAGE